MNIQIPSKNEIIEIKKLYSKAFPDNERKPFFLINKKIKEGKSEILAFFDNNVFVGFAINLVFNEYVLVDYLAIDESKQGQGYGSNALDLIKERYKEKQIFLEVEERNALADNSIQRELRYKFYLKNGFVSCGFKINFFFSKLEVLSYQKVISYNEYIDFQKYVMGSAFVKIAKLHKI